MPDSGRRDGFKRPDRPNPGIEWFNPMPRFKAKPSTGTWLSDARVLFVKYYRSPQLAEQKLASAMESGVRWGCQEYEGRLGYAVGDRRFWKRFWERPRRALRSLKYEDCSAEFFAKPGRKPGRSTLWGIWVLHEDLLAWLQEDGLTLLPEDMPAPDASAGSGAPEAPPKRHGRQIDRVYRELLVQFPPNGKTPARMTINTITRKLAPGWKAENKEYGLTDPSPDVVAAAVKIVGRRAD